MPKLGKLDDESLKLVEVEFNRLKKRTPFKDYRISEYLDSGGFARVYCVRCPTSEVKFALRISEEEEHYNEREIQAVRQLMNQGQKHIVEYLMYFTVNTRFGKKYCALMPFLSPLSKYNNTSDDIEIAVRCGNDLLPVLQSCSEVVEGQIIHRDIKPQNIFFDNDFRKDRGLMLGDFGIARIENETQRVTPIGSPETISPEIGANDIDIMHDHHLCDIYSLGIVMYYYLNGHVYPFDNDHKKRLQTKGALPEPRYGSKRLKQLVVKATQYYPKDRFASPREMLEELWQCEEYVTFILGSDFGGNETLKPDSERIEQKNQEIMELKAQLEHTKFVLSDFQKQAKAVIMSQQTEAAALKATVDELDRQIKQARSEIKKKEQELETLRKENAELTIKLQNYDSIQDNSTLDPPRIRFSDVRDEYNREYENPSNSIKSHSKKKKYYLLTKWTSIFTVLSSLLLLLFVFQIRIIDKNRSLTTTFQLFDWLFKSLGKTTAHIWLSITVSITAFIILFLFGSLRNSIRIAINAICNIFVTQMLYILFYHWISPPVNTVIEQTFIYLIVVFIVIHIYSRVENENSKQEFGLGLFASIFFILFLLPSFIILLPGWWGWIPLFLITIIASGMIVNSFSEMTGSYYL